MNSIRNTNKFVLFIFILQFIMAFFWANIMEFFKVPIQFNLILLQITVFGIPILIYLLKTKQNFKETLSIRKLKLLNIILIILISIFIQPVMSLIAAISNLFFPNTVSELFIETIYNNVPIWQLLISIALTPAIFEEFMFRGIIFQGYKTTSIFKACLISGFIFGMAHMDLQQSIYASIMGMFFCFMLYKTKSIFAPMLSHFVINGTQVLLSYVELKNMENLDIINSLLTPSLSDKFFSIFIISIIVLFTLPILILLILAFLKTNKNIKTEEIYYNLPKYRQEKIFDKPIISVISIFCLQAIILQILPKIIKFLSF